jgi:hypothetical protein
MSFLSNAVALIKGDLEADGIPVAIGALSILQKNGINAASIAAAELYLMGNAPAALITAEQQFAQQELAALSTALAGIKIAPPTTGAAT